MPELALKEIQARAFCNWCRRPLQGEDGLSEGNFIDTGKIFPANQKKAYAVFCNTCKDDDFRVKQPKSALNKETLDEVNIELLPESKQEAKAAQKDKEETLKATGAKEALKASAAAKGR
jgi:hypothetical protein